MEIHFIEILNMKQTGGKKVPNFTRCNKYRENPVVQQMSPLLEKIKAMPNCIFC